MRRTKFSFNAFVLIVILLSALILFITVGIRGMTGRPTMNEIFEIGYGNLSVRHCDVTPSGIYRGTSGPGELALEGTYDSIEWGAFLSGKYYVCNEYSTTTLGMLKCRVVKIDLDSFSKETLYEDSFIIGTCASGEAVIVRGFSTVSWMTDTNPLYKLYVMSDKDALSASGVSVDYVDTETLGVVKTVCDVPASDVADRENNTFLEADLREVAR